MHVWMDVCMSVCMSVCMYVCICTSYIIHSYACACQSMLRSLLGGAMADSAMALGAPQCSSAPAFFHHQRHFCFFSSTPRNCLNIRRRITASSSPPPSSSSSSSPLYSDSIDPIYEEKTLSVDLETIRSEEQFEEVMAEASHPKIINW